MLPGKKLSTVILFLFILTDLSGTAYAAKSVYVIRNTETSQIYAYKVNGTNLIYQTDYNCVLDPPDDAGAVAIAIDESDFGDFLFVTFESSDEVEIVNAKTMQYVDTVIAPGANNLAGVVFDQGRQKVNKISEILFDLARFSGIIKYNKGRSCSEKFKFNFSCYAPIQRGFAE